MIDKQCFLCNKPNPSFVITEIENGDYLSFELCSDCADNYLSETREPEILDLEEEVSILTIEDFLEIFKKRDPDFCNVCQMTEKEFKKYGKFGCSNCYKCFGYIMEKVVYKYHGDKSHIGKSPDTKLKNLKLFYAKALEVEDYEKASKLKSQIDELDH